MVRGLRVCILLVPAVSSKLLTTSCGPQTKLSYSDTKDAAGTPLWGDVAVSGGACVNVDKKSTEVRFCGPGTLTLSRMTCDQHAYKALTYEHPASAWTTECEDIPAVGAIDGQLGSAKVTC